MSRNKQIEEMARIIDDNHGFIVSSVETAEELYNAGYRKASEIARAIFEEIEDVLNNIGYFDELDFNALKKKYIGKDTNAPTKETEDN